MGSKAAEEPSNTETDEGTVAIMKKRLRRVSFAAEITSVHVFDRDDESDTHPYQKPGSDNSEFGQCSEELGFLPYGDDSKDSLQNEEEDEYDEDDELDVRRSFLRPMESPSPGSTFSSATSDDEENFFGPVSASFIRPGRLSDSAASDDNHDVTMDSTAFSMHFRSLARSDSGGDMKTQTGVHLSFEEKTPSLNTIPGDEGSSMALTIAKKVLPQSCVPVNKLRAGSDSNDMSIVEENPRRYDYAILPPDLDALFNEGSKNLHPISVLDGEGVSKSPINIENKISPLKRHINGSVGLRVTDGKNKQMEHFDTLDMVAGGVPSTTNNKVVEASSMPNKASSASAVHVDQQNTSPEFNGGALLGNSKESIEDVTDTRGPNLNISAVDGDIPWNLDNKFPRSDELARSEGEPSLAASISSFAVNEKQICINSSSPSNYSGIVTPSNKQAGFFERENRRNPGDSVSSIQKSISKLKMLEASPFSSTLRADFGSKLRYLDYLPKSPYDILAERNSRVAQIRHVDASVANFEEKLLSIAQTNEEQRRNINMNGSYNETPRKIGVSCAEDFAAHVKGGTPINDTTSGILSSDRPIKAVAPEYSPSKFTLLEGMSQQDPLTSECHAERRLVTSGTVSSSPEITFDSISEWKETGTPEMSFLSTERRLEEKSPTSPEFRASHSMEQKLHKQQTKHINFSHGWDTNPNENVSDAKIANKYDSLVMGRGQSSSPFFEHNLSKDFMKTHSLDDTEIELRDMQDEDGTIVNFRTPLADKGVQNFQSNIPNLNIQDGIDPPRFNKDLLERGLSATSAGSASPFIHSSANKTPQNLVELFSKSSSKKRLHNATQNDKVHSYALGDVLSPKSYQLENGSEKNSTLKRSREDMTAGDRDHCDETVRIQKSPKLIKGWNSDSEFLSENPDISDNHILCPTGSDTEMKRWVDVSKQFFGDIKLGLFPSIDKLNLQTISALEAILVHMQRLKLYEILCMDIQSQKTFDRRSNLRHKRVVETRLLLHKIVHEQAKLKLFCAKREKLQDKVEQLRSGIQEAQSLKLKSLLQPSEPHAKDTCVDNSHQQPFSVDFRASHEVLTDKMTAMSHVLEASNRKIINLTKSFHTLCKMKGEPSCSETMVLVSDHMKKKTRCRRLRLELQLWEVDNLENENGHHCIALSYIGFITQRFKIAIGPVSSMVISNKLNDRNIIKNFPNTNACTAFAFVFNSGTTQKFVGPRSLIQETQKTSLLLGSLLDVVEEVQLAGLELLNLVQTGFYSRSVAGLQQLDLKLTFINHRCGRKVKLTLEVSCLNRGVYPSEIVPSQLEVSTNDDDATRDSHSVLAEEIKSATQSVRVGYTRIIRLCRCISELVQGWSSSSSSSA